jgi:hypothetical protein
MQKTSDPTRPETGPIIPLVIIAMILLFLLAVSNQPSAISSFLSPISAVGK